MKRRIWNVVKKEGRIEKREDVGKLQASLSWPALEMYIQGPTHFH